MPHKLTNVLFALLCLWLVACGSESTSSPASEAATQPEPSEPRIFQVRGIIKEIPDTGTSLRIQHEAIPDYMPAMTMPFSAKNREAFADLKVDDNVSFTLHVSETESWIDNLAPVVAPQAPTEMPSISSFRQVRDVEPLAVGDSLPNYPFTDQDGQAFSLDDFRGQVLVMTFIYTRCPLPDFCPRMNVNFLSAYQALKKDPTAPADWQLLSISFDPAHDTPEVLRNYAEAYAYDPEKWRFATGEMIEIDAITEQFGLVFSRSQGKATDWDHNLRTVVVNPKGIITQIYIGNTWTPESLIADLKVAAKETESPATSETAPAWE